MELTQRPTQPGDAAAARAASLIAQGFADLQRALSSQSGLAETRAEMAAARGAMMSLAARLEKQRDEEREQRGLLRDQLGSLATSLDRLVSHLEGISQPMGDLLERLAEPARPAAQTTETPFVAGGEGVTVALASAPGFQGLMDIQKAITAMDQVAGAFVERYQEGDSRMLLHISRPVTAMELANAISATTGFGAVVEEAKPELQRLRIKVLPPSGG